MSLMTGAKASLAVLGLGSLVAGLETETAVPNDDPTWNYDNHGTDWTMGDCPDTSLYQSPWAIQSSILKDQGDQYSFLPVWQTASVSASQHGVTDYVYQIQASEGNMGGWYAVEPYASAAQIYWQVSGIRFHYPSEHTIDDVQYPLEMQIMADDIYTRAERCKNNIGAFSLMFEVGDTQSSFWDWVGTSDIQSLDLNLLFTKPQAMTTQMYSYVGTDTMPNCTDLMCWYINMPVQTITQATLDLLKDANVAFNNRATNLGDNPPGGKYLNNGALYTAPAVNTEL